MKVDENEEGGESMNVEVLVVMVWKSRWWRKKVMCSKRRNESIIGM